VDEGLLRHAHSHHLLVFSQLERMGDVGRLAGLGLDGIITDDPRAVVEGLAALPPT
jgi:glycerophosphoryl diester phosphodiesterase